MFGKLGRHIRQQYSGFLALFIALGGMSYAAVTLPGNSVGSLQIKRAVMAACKVRYLRCLPEELPSVPELQLLVPQVGPSARGPQAAPATPAMNTARDHLASTLASKRRERSTLWADSGFLQDSFFGVDARMEGGHVSAFGSLSSGLVVREAPTSGKDAAGIGIDSAPSALRH